MRVSCIIIARGGSKGIPNKNILDFCNKPLLAWTVLQAKASDQITDVWISSDSDEILNIGEQYGAIPIKRPNQFSTDISSSEDAWLHALEYIESSGQNDLVDYVLAPQVTSPLRSPEDFSNGISQIIKTNSDSLFSVSEIEDFFTWKNNQVGSPESINYNYLQRKPRQQIEKHYLENGSFYIFKPSLLRQKRNRLGGKISMFVMERYKMFQIDNMEDIKLCEVIMKGYQLDSL